MTQPKPLLTIKGKCPKCEDHYEDRNFCKICNCSGQQTIEITPLRDFEKCEEKWHKNFNGIYGKVKCYKCGFIRNEIGYKIPKEYEHYEIKKVCKVMWENKEITKLEGGFEIFKKHNLKDDDKVVVRRK